MKNSPMRLTLIHPYIGRVPGQKYIGTWRMEPLPTATPAGLTPTGVIICSCDECLEETLWVQQRSPKRTDKLKFKITK